MSDQDVIASVVGDQDGQTNEAGVGQDEGTIHEESSSQDWESQAKYHQSEKDKLYAENQQLKQYEKVGKFLESRPDLVENLMSEVNGQPKQPVIEKPEEFDPWEAYNDPSSASYKFRMQEMQNAIDGAVDEAVSGIQVQQGKTNLRAQLSSRGLDDAQINNFFEFAERHPSEYGLDNVLKMWQAVTQAPQESRENPLNKVRQNQTTPTSAGVLQGQQPVRKNDLDVMWEGIKNSGDKIKF
tara:strand:- start:300 stop:1019 length:720 start_codon:yes stop_codon:yes gene_type:complete